MPGPQPLEALVLQAEMEWCDECTGEYVCPDHAAAYRALREESERG